MDRWAIYIDIEGTSRIYSSNEMQFLSAFNALLESICAIGVNVCSESPDRLFVHQVGGDGLLVVSEFNEGKPDMPIALAVILMQVLLRNGVVGKGGISEGSYANVTSCFPSLRQLKSISNTSYQLGRGILTVLPGMGTALINAHRLASQPPSGSRLALDRSLAVALPPGIVISKEEEELVVEDWVHTKTPLMEDLLLKTNQQLPSPVEFETRLADYILKTPQLRDTEWGRNALELNNCCGTFKRP